MNEKERQRSRKCYFFLSRESGMDIGKTQSDTVVEKGSKLIYAEDATRHWQGEGAYLSGSAPSSFQLGRNRNFYFETYDLESSTSDAASLKSQRNSVDGPIDWPEILHCDTAWYGLL